MLGLVLESQHHTGLEFTMPSGLGAEALDLPWKGLPFAVSTGFLSFPFEQALEFPMYISNVLWDQDCLDYNKFWHECVENK